MREVERTLEITGRADDFRQSLIAKIGAWSLDHRGQKPVLSEIFTDLLRKLRDAYFEKPQEDDRQGDRRSRRCCSRATRAACRPTRALAPTPRSRPWSPSTATPRESARDLVGALASMRYR